VRHFFLS